MFKNMLNRLKQKKCKHESIKTITNIYGNNINYYNARSIRICEDCHKVIWHKELDKEMYESIEDSQKIIELMKGFEIDDSL